MQKLDFIVFYSLFILFVIQLSGMAGQTILSNYPQFENVPTDSTTLLNPLSNIGFWIGLLTVSTDYQIIFTLILLPFIIGIAWIIVEIARGV